MSKKQPEIKVIYPDASAAAMLLTDAMIRRSTGKRVVETNSEEKEYTGEQLFGGVLSTKTDTSVELTLRLNPDAMDYALTMLVAKNLTEEEKRAIRMETDSMEIVELLSAHAAGAAGASTCTDDVGSAERAADGAPTQSGGQNVIDVPLLAAPKDKDEEESDTWLTAMLATLIHLAINSKASKKNRARDIAFIFPNREEIGIPDSAWTTCAAIDKALEEAYEIARAINKADPGQVDADDLFERLLHEMDPDEYPMEENVQLDKADEAESEHGGEIEPGLLNDIETENKEANQ